MSLVTAPSTPGGSIKRRLEHLWTAKNIGLYLMLIGFAFATLLPLLFVITTSLKSDTTILEIPPRFLPDEARWDNFATAWTKVSFGPLLLNSVILTALNIIGRVGASMVIGYGLSRIKFAGRKFWFYMFIGSMMLPGIISLIPIFKLFFALGWYGTWWPLIVPPFFGDPFYIFLIRQYYLSIPRALDEAAMIDGASHWQIFTKIMVPLTRPAWIACAVFAFQGGWNDYLTALIYLPLNPERWPLALGLAALASPGIGGVTVTPWNLIMAANLLYMIPSILVFFGAQRHFMQGVGALSARTQK
jgi:ABC-type glycerol-3-phosphate transport system permease component